LAYSDYPGQRLVNNLNLIIMDPASTPHVGNSTGGNTFDSTNNVEVVVIPQAAAGTYELQVVGSDVPFGPQPFALVIIGALASTTEEEIDYHTNKPALAGPKLKPKPKPKA
jgi:serine protease AprX